MRFFGSGFASLFLLLTVTLSSAWADGPLATIVFTGNSFGEFRACPTCGHGAVGGLDRRATLFDRIRAEAPEALFIATGYEFASYSTRRKVRPEVMEPLADVYGRLGYDLGVALPLEARIMGDAGATMPSGFVTLGDEPFTRVFERGGLRIGFVVLGRKADAYKPAGEKALQAALNAAGALRPSVDILVGVSTWGERDEVAFAKNHPGTFDILLGSGVSAGYGVRALGDGATVWCRPMFDGRGLVRLDVLALPEAGQPWRDGREYASQMYELGVEVASDADISAVFSWY